MKTPYVVLVLLSFVLFINTSCDQDDNNSDDDRVVLTTQNNLYEGDLYRLYLDGEILATNTQIDIVTNELENDPNNEDLIAQLEVLESALGVLQEKVETQNQYEALLINVPRVPRIPPLPPQPCLSGACIPNILSYISITEDIKSIEVTIRNMQTEETITTVSIDAFTPLSQYNNVVSATPIFLQGFTGAISIDVRRVNRNNETVFYTLNGNIY